jgi:hypothetical protein
MKIPEINKTYNCFDDGKISETRRYEVKIKEVIPFANIDSETLKVWKEEVEYHDWLYNTTTDYFVKCYTDEHDEELVFVRDMQKGWYSLGFWGGQLDIDGGLFKKMKDWQNEG